MSKKINVDYINWLLENTNLSEASVERYESGVRVISEEMLQAKIIDKPLDEYDTTELAIAILLIFNNEEFIHKNTVGKNMYSNSIKHFQAFKKSVDTIPQDNTIIKKIQTDKKLTTTEKESIIKARVGQGIFRNNVMKKYNEKCIVTNIADKRLLIASHIKPWAVSNNADRIDSENGFLLNCLYDKMFDLGLITFSDEGKILISKSLTSYDKSIIKIDTERKFDLNFSKKLLQNLEYHRDMIFLK